MINRYQTLCAGLTTLKMETMRASLDNIIDRVNSGEISFIDGMATLVKNK